MPKTTAVPYDLRQEILRLHEASPSLSARKLAKEFGLHHKTVSRILRTGALFSNPTISDNVPANAVSSGKPEMVESSEIEGNNWTISLPKTRIHTLDELIAFCEVDLSEWQVNKFICNKWEVGIKKGIGDDAYVEVEPLFQVKAFLSRKLYETTDEYALDNMRLRSQLEKTKTRLRIESDMTRRLAQNHAGFDDLLDNIKSFTDKFGDFHLPEQRTVPLPPLFVPPLTPNHSEDAVFLISDTHFGDKIRKEDTSGFQEFDIEIAGNRMGYLIQKAKEVLTLHRTMYPIDILHLWFGGDIGNGELHDSALSNELNIIEQVHFSYHMLKFAVEDLLTLTNPCPENGLTVVKKLNLLFTVGNHTRMDIKMPYKLQARRTFDWLIYQMLIDRFKDDPRISIKTEVSPFIFENIRGHRHLFCHGMQVGYKNSPDQQGKSVSRFMVLARALFDSPQWRKENHLEGETFSRACIGDIHVPVSFPRFISNGSLNGQNELGVNWQLEPIPAGMQLFGVANKHQETWKYFLDCTEVQRQNPNSYADFAKNYKGEINR